MGIFNSFNAPQSDNLKVAMDQIVMEILNGYNNQPQLGIPTQLLEHVWALYQKSYPSVRQGALRTIPQQNGNVSQQDLILYLQNEVDETIKSEASRHQSNLVLGGPTGGGGMISTQQRPSVGSYHGGFQTQASTIQTPAWVAQQQRQQQSGGFGQQSDVATITADNSIAAKKARDAMLQRQQAQQQVIQPPQAQPQPQLQEEPAASQVDLRDLKATVDPEVKPEALNDPTMQTVEHAQYYTKEGLGIFGNVLVDSLPPWRDGLSAASDLLANLPVLTKYDQWLHRFYYNEMRSAKVPAEGMAAVFDKIGEQLTPLMDRSTGAMPLDCVSTVVLPAFAHVTKLTGDYIEKVSLRVMNDLLFHHLRDPENLETEIVLSGWSELPILINPIQPAHKQIIGRLRSRYPDYDVIVGNCLSQTLLSLFGKSTPRVLNLEEHAAAIATARGINFRVGNYLPRDAGVISEAMKETFQAELRKYLVHVQTRMTLITNVDPAGFATSGRVTVLRRPSHPLHKIVQDNLGALDITLLFVRQNGSELSVERQYRIGQTLDRTMLIFG